MLAVPSQPKSALPQARLLRRAANPRKSARAVKASQVTRNVLLTQMMRSQDSKNSSQPVEFGEWLIVKQTETGR